jgi:hypothetical protein
MDTSLTPQKLQDLYNQLYTNLRLGNLPGCYESHLKIALNLGDSGAYYLAAKHRESALKIRKILNIVGVETATVAASIGLVNESESMESHPEGLILKNTTLEGLELRLIELLKQGAQPRREVLKGLFGGYATDILSETVLRRVIDNINRHVARIIDVSATGYSLKVVSYQ